MLEFQFLKRDRILNGKILEDTVNFMVVKFKQSLKLFSYSTAYGQLTITMNNVSQLLLYFIKDAAMQSNIATANRPQSVQGMAQLVGHNAMRGKSATGEIIISLKQGAKTNLIQGNLVVLPNYLKVKCVNNGVDYMLDLSRDYIEVDLIAPKPVYLRIVEGAFELQSLRGNGENIQTFQVNAGVNKFIDDTRILVEVDGKPYPPYVDLRDIPYKQPGCLIKTSITSGISVVTGNALTHEIPANGSDVSIHYLVTKGTIGNLSGQNKVYYKFVDTGLDINGNEVNLNDYFDISNSIAPDFGADPEPIELTRILAPNISKNAIIHDKKSIEYYFGRMNYFSAIKVFRDEYLDNQNTYNTLLIPRLKDRIGIGQDYFNCDINLFALSQDEKNKLLTTIHESNIKSSNIIIKLINPKFRYFAVSVLANIHRSVNGMIVVDTEVEKKIRAIMSEYFLNVERMNLVPHSDIVKLIDLMDEIDSVKVVFHPQFNAYLDETGSVNLADDELAVCRGGFIDETGIEYFDKFDPNDGSHGSFNVQLKYVSVSNF